jgi:dinuclear metal center YbgI/SA1388 family protein
MARLADVVAFLDTELRTREIPDYATALNGLQFGDATNAEVTHVAAAVDYSTVTIREAVARGANLLLLHHGMFWGGLTRLTEYHFERIELLVRHGIAVYSSHLPLDVHPRYGNNALLAARLGLTPSGGFARHATIDVGVRGTCDVATETLVTAMRELATAHDGVVVTTPIAAGRRTRAWGLCTGAGASPDTLREAMDYGLDTLIVGEGPHHTAVHARDLGIAVIYGGHYATETLGVEAVAHAVAKRFTLESSFIDAPTGL